MLGLTFLGEVHTAISLIAVAAGVVCLVRDKAISRRSAAGRIYVWTTILTCLTGFCIFQHGGFGKPHVLGIITLVALAIADLAERRRSFGAYSGDVEVVAYSATFLFHMIPALTETFTRLPAGNPVFAGPDDPILAKITGMFALIFVAAAALQVRHLRRSGFPASRA
jgi:uncharacterized membrane protein